MAFGDKTPILTSSFKLGWTIRFSLPRYGNTPIENTWDHFFLNGSAVSDDFMNERGEQKPIDRENL